MGLAASQARSILLEAKISDVEFEAQQINQARTKLGDQSAAYMQQLVNMEVPVPPSKSDFTTMQYSYNQNGVNNTITNMGTVDKNGNTSITTQHKGYGATVSPMTGANASVPIEEKEVQVNNGSVILTSPNDENLYRGDDKSLWVPVTKANGTGYNPGAQYVNANNEDQSEAVANAVKNVIASGTYYNSDATKASDFSENLYTEIKENTDKVPITDDEGNITGYEDKPNGTYSVVEGSKADPNEIYNQALKNLDLYMVVDEAQADAIIGNGADYETKYYHNGEEINMDESLDENNEAHKELIKAIKQTGGNPDDYCVVRNGNNLELLLKADVKDGDGTATRYQVKETDDALIEGQENVTLNFDDNGRVASFTDSNGMTIALTPQQVTNEVAYEDAMNKYEYDKQMYNKEQAEINAQMSILQQQDKKLELKLNQLDTERQELTTELEAVKKVLGEHAEFKTFNG